MKNYYLFFGWKYDIGSFKIKASNKIEAIKKLFVLFNDDIKDFHPNELNKIEKIWFVNKKYFYHEL